MTVKELASLKEFKSVVLPEPKREICGVYIGDLLSWVMGRASSNDAWITIMSNVNVLAVASLADTSCIILAEGVTLENDIIETAEQKGINIISSDLSAYNIAVTIGKML
ncbi:MAG: hypothetical protein E7560_00870 [Ruminococcaceae bacterium]|nr:hypothetical protein [Oscillospiraceae bacterium]